MRRTAEEAARTRQALLRAALPVFAERGYAAATLAGIAERAGVTRGAAYHHFHDKAALYLATISELWAEAAAPAIMMSVNGPAATWPACPELFSPADQAEALADAVLYGLTDRTLAGAELTDPGTRSGEPRGSGLPTSG
ncbi:TetR family transcriptional regulator [Nonomuraea rubra]|uniref:AcrR family transcriptional regulator n=1 Tax=Nonomuraea rubra TaxID=46180 RepID=A0A7X0P0K7_9ACTN|nr:TetR family transcriptional regulator [Nonomuraea rubra]MBB6553062.1 AcrR family transcriptional regulator [Nonomuraea rubra]